ncbi:MAG: hypothetical protein EXS32_05160 [Opitutus sp.]|nr:hypothetical protein [Opitutus sp.]
MTLSAIWRTRVYGTVAAVLAVWLAFLIAQEQYFWPLVSAGGFVALGVVYLQPLPLPTVLLGGAVIGYIVGNRGFAQVSLAGQFPLLPAEFVLLVAGVALAMKSAAQRRLPLRRDALNFAILLWMACCSFRLYLDLRLFQFAAVRDFATVYYASFFFLAQEAGTTEAGRRFLLRCLLGACAALLVVYPLFVQWPGFFLELLTIRGVPLVFFKGDLVGTFMAVGALLLFLRFEQKRSFWSLAGSLGLIALVVSTNNRASMLGLAVGSLLLAFAGRWRFAAFQTGAAIAAAIVILFVAYLRHESWEHTPLHGVYERVVSLGDPLGQHNYSGVETYNKGDNNLFRAVWWRTCIDETLHANPWLGLGWGYDLAEGFARIYYPDGTDDFLTRSPHNVVITVFARAGFAGLGPFLFLLVVLVTRAWRAARTMALETAGLWASVCVILTSACLGVVLEGPMGAVVFWVVLGLASAAGAAGPGPAADLAVAADLPSGARADEVAVRTSP